MSIRISSATIVVLILIIIATVAYDDYRACNKTARDTGVVTEYDLSELTCYVIVNGTRVPSDSYGTQR